MKKKIWIIIGVLVLLVIAGGAGIWWWMQQPLYEPGMVRAGKNLAAPLDPPTQAQGTDTWLVETGISLHHFADGEGTPVLVIHGGPGNPFTQAPAGLHALAQRYRFEYYDQRGCGESTRPIQRFESSNTYQNMLELDKKLGLGAQIADIERIRRILGEEKLILVGHSFGGFIASLYAAEFPEHVRELVLVAPAEMLVMPVQGGLFEEVKDLLPQEKRSEYDAFMKRYLDFNKLFGYTDEELAAMNDEFGLYYLEAAKAKGFKIQDEDSPAPSSGGWMTWGMYVSMGQRHDYRTALRSVTAPVLVIHGSADMQSEQASRTYTEAFPNARFEVIQGSGHFPFNDNPSAFAQIVGGFLDGLK